MPNKYNATALILTIAIAVFFRFWQFDSIPPGLYQDEAMNGADALSSLENGKFSVFYTNNNGREGMIIWLDVLAIKLFGNEPWVLRLFPALAGVLAVLGLFFLAKKLFSIEIALASSFFMATSFWAVNFSRIGFRANLMVPILIWSFYFLLRAVKRFWLGFAIFAVTAFIVALPIGLYFLNNPGDFFGRSGQVSTFSADNPLKASILSVAATFGMFNIIGDLNWRHNFAGYPQLLLPVGILFILGILICAKRKNLSDKFLFLWLFIFLLPNILSTEGNPHALRALGTMPAAMVFAGVGLVWICEKIKKYLDDKISNSDFFKYRPQLIRIKKELFILLVVFLFFISFSEFNKYFVKWASNIRTADAFSQSHVKIADYLNLLPENVNKYVIWPSDDRPTENDLPVSAQTVYFLTYGKSDINYVKSNEIDKINLGANGAIIATLNSDLELLHDLNKKFPSGKVEFIYLNTPILIVP